MPVPVDTGRSLVILGACFYVNFIILGIGRLSGIFFVASMDKFNVDRATASFPYTFCSFMECISGPLFGYLGHKFGIHKILIIGSLFCTFGLGVCYLVENIGFISLFYGLIFGLGGGTILMIPVLINQNFYKYRAIASGIRSSAMPFGSLILPLFTNILLNKYDLSGTFLILTGLVFNCLPATLLMWTMNFDYPSKKHPNYSIPTDAERKPLLQDEKTIKVYSEKMSKQKNLTSSKKETHLKPELKKKRPDFVGISSEAKIAENSVISKENLEIRQSVYNKSEKYIEDIFNSEEKDIEGNKGIKKQVLESSKYIHQPTKSSNKTQKVTFFSVIREPVFICIALETVLYTFTNKSLMIVIVDFARDIGLSDKEQSYTLVVFSVGELFGSLGLGWLIDKSYIKKTTFLFLTCFLQSVIAIIIAFSNGSFMLLSLLLAMGCVNSPPTFLGPLLIKQYLSENKQTIAMPSVPFLSAPFTLLVSPLIGFLREGLGSYEYMFYILGICSLVCGLIFLIIPCISKSKK